MPPYLICRPDLEDQFPLPVQRSVGRPQRIARIVNICSFGRRSVQLDDLKSFAGSKLFIAAVSNVVSPDIETREAAFRLRFLVFNLELNESLECAYEAGYDTDEFDKACDHLIVEHRPSQQVVGTYRLQTGRVAGSNLGYYSEREFDFSPYEPIRNSIVELGRASIHRDHRSFEVLTLLWRGIASYALQRNARYLVGCSSLTSQCPQEGSDMYWRLKEFLVEPVLRTSPRHGFTIPISAAIPETPRINPPRLFAQTAEKRSLTLDGAERVIAAAKAEAAKVKAPGGVIAVESVAPSISQSGANGWSRMESADSHQEPSAAI